MKLLKNLRISESLIEPKQPILADIFVGITDSNNKLVIGIAGDDPLAVAHAAVP